MNIAKILLQHKAVKVSFTDPFHWASGIISPIYCDNRLMISFPAARAEIVAGLVEKIKKEKLDFEVVAGTESAAIPWAAFVAQALDKPMVYIRKQAKEHGAKKRVEGFLEPGQKVLVIEDLISTGGSSVNAAQAVQAEGGKVTDILAIVSWGLKLAVSTFAEAGLNLHTLTSYEELVDTALKLKTITSEQHEKIKVFKADPAGWAEKVGIKSENK